MGSGYELSCRYCDYRQPITLGVGMDYSSIETLLDIVPRSRRAEVQEALAAHPESRAEYRHALYRCTACNCRDGRFYYKVDSGGGRTLESDYHCRHCHAPLEREPDTVDPNTPGATDSWPCPGCGNTGLRAGLTLLWD